MSKKYKSSFTQQSQELSTDADGRMMLHITGERAGAPSSRFTFRHNGLKILDAKITRTSKNKEYTYEVSRINHLPSMGEIRLHTSSPLYPGYYDVLLVLNADTEDSEEKMPNILR